MILDGTWLGGGCTAHDWDDDSTRLSSAALLCPGAAAGELRLGRLLFGDLVGDLFGRQLCDVDIGFVLFDFELRGVLRVELLDLELRLVLLRVHFLDFELLVRHVLLGQLLVGRNGPYHLVAGKLWPDPLSLAAEHRLRCDRHSCRTARSGRLRHRR
jgi:hypothetical protein